MKNIGIILVRIALLLLLAGLFFGHLASETYQMTEAKNGVLVVFFDKNLKQYFAYDINKKALVFLDSNLNITDVLNMKVR